MHLVIIIIINSDTPELWTKIEFLHPKNLCLNWNVVKWKGKSIKKLSQLSV